MRVASKTHAGIRPRMASMNHSKNRAVWLICCFGTSLLLPIESLSAFDQRFSRDILPILSDRCFHCHGPDDSHREADLRLDLEAAAKEDRDGYAVVVPGSLEKSELWQRIATDDDDLVMPPLDSHRKPITEKEREAIRLWILNGAKWGKHWSLEAPVKVQLPKLAAHPIDAFVRQRLADKEFEPAVAAAKYTQLRRLSFALTGVSPDPAELQTFLADSSDTAWAAAVDRKLAAPEHAERMAMWWLDAARYSDSDGFQQDNTRENWPWRDWVVDAFAENMPFDRFTIEQFAGDLLPDATNEQILATCFHRNHMTNGEGGRDPEESRVDYVIDRVNTTGTIWLGLTLGCTQCHSHKFDPISQQDYYSFSAFFNSIDEDGKAGKGAKPYLNYTSGRVESQIAQLKSFVATCRQAEASELALAKDRFAVWLRDQRKLDRTGYKAWHTPTPRATGIGRTKFSVDGEQVIQTSGPDMMHDDYRIELEIPASMTQVTGWRVEVFPHESHQDGRFTRFGNGDFTLTSSKILARRLGSPSEVELEQSSAVADYEADKARKTAWDPRYTSISKTLNDDARDGWTTEGAQTIQPHVGVYALSEPWSVEAGDRLVVVLQQRSTHGHASIGRFRISIAGELGDTVRRVDGGSPLKELFGSGLSAADSIDNALRQRLLAQYLLSDAEYQRVSIRFKQVSRQLKALEKELKPRSVMVLKERAKPRPTHVLVRGVWDAKGDAVQSAVLPSVLDWPADQSKNRLDLAKWLIDRDNPLTARVMVNHLWQLMFGAGLVRTPEDFGLQGQLPTHPEMLDWLAVELMEHDWDLRHILRLIATSQTFRQSSRLSAELIEQDPQNRWLARAPKYRLSAWMLRDNALKISGLLDSTMGGPPVYPYQPEGVWAEITMGRFHYQPSLGSAQYRKTLYAFWRRSSAPAFLFDSAQRRVCEIGVRRTNTPLHALVLMNDTTMLEASRALAESVSVDLTVQQTLQALALRVISRRLTAAELADLVVVFQQGHEFFGENNQAASTYVTVGQRPAVPSADAADMAAWMTVSNLLLNLDEAISYE